jgi:hypothetical protein
MSKGGKRAGAGRKGHGLTLVQEWAVGGEYERVLNELAEKRAWDKYKRSPKGEDIEDIRSDVLNGDEPINRETLSYLEEQLDDMDRRVELPQNIYGLMPAARQGAIAWCKLRYGVTITESKADECLKAFRRIERRLIST